MTLHSFCTLHPTRYGSCRVGNTCHSNQGVGFSRHSFEGQGCASPFTAKLLRGGYSAQGYRVLAKLAISGERKGIVCGRMRCRDKTLHTQAHCRVLTISSPPLHTHKNPCNGIWFQSCCRHWRSCSGGSGCYYLYVSRFGSYLSK